MLCGLGQDYETRNFLEVENSLIRLVISTCTLKNHYVFQCTLDLRTRSCCSPSISYLQVSSSGDVQVRISGEPQKEKRIKTKIN